MKPEDVPNVLVEKAGRAIWEHDNGHTTWPPRDPLEIGPAEDAARAVLAAVWADVRLPDPTGGCVCSFESEYRGGGHYELVQEPEPACPVHSEHVYDPVLGVWVLRSEVSRTRPEQPVDPWAEAVGVEGAEPGEGGFF